LQAEAQRVAEIVAKNSPAALAASKRALWRMLQLDIPRFQLVKRRFV
jgi:enoyl-CoA hydratase/carnithine racemase